MFFDIGKTVFVLCPQGLVTGGTEVCHQLVDQLRSLGVEAYVSYVAAQGDSQRTNPAFHRYIAPAAPVIDSPQSIVIVPETLTLEIKAFSRSLVSVWWLSVDNYFQFPLDSTIAPPWQYADNRMFDWFRKYRTRRNRLPLKSLFKVSHFVQSHYARMFLRANGIPSLPLTDYVSDSFLQLTEPRPDNRSNLVLYNPKKGSDATAKLRAFMPETKFVPIVGLNHAQVVELMLKAKVYIDFGNHPGKDRLPREAAMAGCCVITCRSGSASYFEDLPLPDSFRLDKHSSKFLPAARTAILSALNDYSETVRVTNPWRAEIRSEKVIFQNQVKSIFTS